MLTIDQIQKIADEAMRIGLSTAKKAGAPSYAEPAGLIAAAIVAAAFLSPPSHSNFEIREALLGK